MNQVKDVTFKYISHQFLQILIELFSIDVNFDFSKIEFQTSELVSVDPSLFRPDLVVKIGDIILMIEFESSYVGISSKKRFKSYISLYDQTFNEENNTIIFIVISTFEKSTIKEYCINNWDCFRFPLFSLLNFDVENIINDAMTKINLNEPFSVLELVNLALTPLMHKKREDIVNQFYETMDVVSKVKYNNREEYESVCGILLMLSNGYFQKDDPIRKRIQGEIMSKVDCIVEALEESFDEGLNEGRVQGFSEGKSKGFSEGETKAKEDIVRKLLAGGELDMDKISEISDLSFDELEKIKQGL